PPAGDLMSRSLCKLFRTPRVADVHSHMNYYYFYIWRGMLLKSYSRSILRRYRPTKPILYLYGKRKPYMFHSKKWIQMLEEHKESRVVEIERGGHWFLLSHADRTNAEIRKWL